MGDAPPETGKPLTCHDPTFTKKKEGCSATSRLTAVGAETHAVEGGVIGGVTAVVHAVGLGGGEVLEKVHVGAGNHGGVTCCIYA